MPLYEMNRMVIRGYRVHPAVYGWRPIALLVRQMRLRPQRGWEMVSGVEKPRHVCPRNP
jgi:hypothetical protein